MDSIIVSLHNDFSTESFPVTIPKECICVCTDSFSLSYNNCLILKLSNYWLIKNIFQLKMQGIKV